jgi:glyoxylase-like metal-dependent hydrolase (beta-lactamase superfamily II)
MSRGLLKGAAFLAAAGLSVLLAGTAYAAEDAAAKALVAAAYAAMGQTDRYAGEGTPPDQITILTEKGTMKQWDPGESESVADLLSPDWGTATFTNVWDHTRDSWRTEWVRPKAGGGTRNYTEVYTLTGGYVMGADVNGAMPARTLQTQGQPPRHTMSAVRVRTLLREQERGQIMTSMFENPERLSSLPDQTAGGKTYPSVQYKSDNGTFIVMFDSATHLPAVVRTRDFDGHMGDADYDATYFDWRGVGANGRFKLPFHVVHTLNGVNIFDTTMDSITVNTILASDAFTVPIALRGKAPAPAAAEKTPFQWVIRRLANGFYVDSDALYTDDGGTLALTDVGPNISLVTGGSHNTLVVATSDSLVAFDAPGDDGLSNWIIAAAAMKYPGKPFRYVVLTHHHIDHTGGIRAYAAQGATIVVGKGDGDFFRKALAAPQSVNIYGAKPITPNVIEVDGKWSMTVGGRNIEAYSLDNPHAAGYIIPYVPDAKMGFVTDLWNPGPPPATPANPNMVAIVRGMEKAGITPEKFAGGHGAVGNYADLVASVGNAR